MSCFDFKLTSSIMYVIVYKVMLTYSTLVAMMIVDV